jgi:hypothetical protein
LARYDLFMPSIFRETTKGHHVSNLHTPQRLEGESFEAYKIRRAKSRAANKAREDGPLARHFGRFLGQRGSQRGAQR